MLILLNVTIKPSNVRKKKREIIEYDQNAVTTCNVSSVECR